MGCETRFHVGFCETRFLPRRHRAARRGFQRTWNIENTKVAEFFEGRQGRRPIVPIDQQEVRVHIRWLIRRDMPEVLGIEAECFEFPWLESDFIHSLRQRNCIGMVAEYEDRAVGFMIYELHKAKIHVLNFAVASEYRRCGVGSQMIAKLIAKLSPHRRSRIVLEVRETNLAAQLFFRENGFRAVSVLRGYYADTPEDAYIMQHRYRPERQAAAEPFSHITRLAG
jgi:[ribosomal protein S18]-alanine N-acetyltransferase